MNNLIIWGILSVPIVLLSWQTLFHIRNHGFYRFLSWECMAILMAVNQKYWLVDPFSIRQIISWILLTISIYPVTAGLILFKKWGKIGQGRTDEHLYSFEKTTELIETGIYKYIRHPMYCSLLLLTWGLFFKHTSEKLLLIALMSSVFLFLTAIFDEKECIEYFGDKYKEYMKRTKRFIPFVL